MTDPITEINTATNVHFMPLVINQIFRESPVLYRIFRMGNEGNYGLALPSFDGRSLAEPLETGEVGQESATYAVGTVTVTNASTAIVGAGGAAFTAAMATRAYITSADGKDYAIASVTDATNIVLTVPYEGGTLAAQAYIITYFKDTANAEGAYGKSDTWAAGTGDVLGAANFDWKMRMIRLP